MMAVKTVLKQKKKHFKRQ